MTSSKHNVAQRRIYAFQTTCVLALFAVINAQIATAQSDVRIVSVSEAQWGALDQVGSGGEVQYVAMATATVEPSTAKVAASERQQQSVDLYDNLLQAANSGEPIPPIAVQQAPSLPPSSDITPIQGPAERLAVDVRQVQNLPTSVAPAAQPPQPGTSLPAEKPNLREKSVETAELPGGVSSRETPCGPGDFLFGCPYYAGQSGARSVCGVDCGRRGAPCDAKWSDSHPIPWSLFGPGEYVGPPRIEHVSTYFLRVNDLLTLTFIQSRKKNVEHYRIGVGDRLRIESKSDETLDREVQVQPDGVINLPLIGDVEAAGRTLKDFRDDVVEHYARIEQKPLITVTPLEVNNALQEVLKAVTSQSRSAGQALDLRVTPEGTIQAPGVGSVYVQGLTIEEVRSELEARYAATFGPGLLISPSLTDRAKSFVFVGGEVKTPGRYTLEGPTTVMQAIALGGGFNVGANVREVVVFRRDENWCLKATKVNVRAPLYGKDPCPVNDVWLRDNDLVIVPKQRILCADDVIQLYFTRGIYAVFPITFVKDFSQGSTVVP